MGVLQRTLDAISVSRASTPGSLTTQRRSGSPRCRCRCNPLDSVKGSHRLGLLGWNGNGNYEDFGFKHARHIEDGIAFSPPGLTPLFPASTSPCVSITRWGDGDGDDAVEQMRLLAGVPGQPQPGREKGRLGPEQSVDHRGMIIGRGETWAQDEVIGLVNFLQRWRTWRSEQDMTASRRSP